MIGFPHETLAQIEATFNLARELRVHSHQFLTVLPYPGTKLFYDAKKDNLLTIDDRDLSNFHYKSGGYIKSDQWDHNMLLSMVYDINIELNFLNSAFLDTEDERKIFLNWLETLTLRLPEHIIAYIVIGYLYKLKNENSKKIQYYSQAKKLLEKEELYTVFEKYIKLDHYIINDFNDYVENI